MLSIFITLGWHAIYSLLNCVTSCRVKLNYVELCMELRYILNLFQGCAQARVSQVTNFWKVLSLGNSYNFAFKEVFSNGTPKISETRAFTLLLIFLRAQLFFPSLKSQVQTCMDLIIYTLTSVRIFSILFSKHFLRWWQREFLSQSRAYLVADHFLFSRDRNTWFSGYTVRRN